MSERRESGRIFRCVRCGALEGEACEPIRPGKWPTVLRDHEERGARPWWLAERGYIQYTLEDGSGFKLYLWRKPSQPAVVRDGWSPSEYEPQARFA